MLTGVPPVAWIQLYWPLGVLVQSKHNWAHSHSYESYLSVFSGNASSRLKRDWQFLCCNPDAVGDLTNERKSWRDLRLMPQRRFPFPSCTPGQNPRHLTLKYKASDFPLCSNPMWCLDFFFFKILTFMMHSVALCFAFLFLPLLISVLKFDFLTFVGYSAFCQTIHEKWSSVAQTE